MICDKASTILDVARQANVSTMTVTRTFNGGIVAEKTRHRVMRAAKELDYRPNLGAKIMRGGNTMSVGILFSNPANSVIVRRISEILLKKNYLSYVADSLGDIELAGSALRDFLARRVDVVIMQYCSTFSPLLHELEKFPKIIFFTDEPATMPSGSICVLSRGKAYSEAIDYLISGGKTNFWSLGRSTYATLKAFSHTLVSYGIPHRHCETSGYPSKPLFANHIDALRDLLRTGKRPDVLVTSEVIVAAQAIQVCQEFGLAVPDDVAVISGQHDDLAAYCETPVATINRKETLLANAVCELLAESLDERGSPSRTINVEASFELRNSATTRQKGGAK